MTLFEKGKGDIRAAIPAASGALVEALVLLFCRSNKPAGEEVAWSASPSSGVGCDMLADDTSCRAIMLIQLAVKKPSDEEGQRQLLVGSHFVDALLQNAC